MENNKIPYRGLSNFGNSCYFNSSIQFLKPVFDTITLSSNYDQTVFETLSIYYKNYYNRDQLFNKYRYICAKINSNGGQQDSDEAILVLLDDIISIKNEYIKKTFDFDVKYKNLIKCSKCKKFKICNDGNDQIEVVLISKYFTQGSDISYDTVKFSNFLGHVLNKENIDLEFIKTFRNETSCDCNKNCVMMQTVLTDMPKFLIIYINRCDGINSTKAYGKLQIANQFEITTPESLEKRCTNENFSNKNHTYNLYGIVIHSGRSIHGGHYYTYSKDVQTDEWYCCNDSSVEKINNFDQNREDIQSNCSALLYIKNN